MICKNCGKNIKDEGIKMVETNVEIIYDISFDSQGDIQYEQSDIESGNGDTIFCCAGCGAELGNFEEKEIIKILK